MSTEIERRVVELEFQNHGFEKSVKASKKQIDDLNKSLKFDGATRAVNDVNTAIKGLNLTSIQTGVNKIAKSFSEMGVAGTVAIQRVANAAITAGKNIVKSLTIDPVNMGLAEYETQMNAVQTILANTRSKGSTLDDVNRALDELNYYADKTIYNFTEMTRNIGTFTAAGVDLNTSVTAIQGIANLAAVSGSNATQASTAMYQLSQALAAGKISLMDWNSVVHAGMGGEIFQTALEETSRALSTGVDAAIAAKGSFRESLQEGWLTSQVLTETLKKFTSSGAIEYVSKYTGLTTKAVKEIYDAAEAEYGEADAIEEASKQLAKKSGKNQQEIKDILEFAKSAEDAATKVKTFSQLMDTLKEAVQSGWSQTWRTVIGDFEEARELFTSIRDVMGDVIEKSANLRNAMLKVWKDLGGRTKLLEGLARISKSILDIRNSVKQAFIDVFYITGKELYAVTQTFAEFTKQLVASSTTLQDIKRIVRGVASVLDVFGQIFTAVIKGIASVYVYFKPLISQVLRFAAIVGDAISIVGYVLKQTQIFTRLAMAAARTLAVIIELLENLGRVALAVGLILFDRMFSIVKMAITIHKTIDSTFGGILGMIEAIFKAFGQKFPAFQKFMDAVAPAFEDVGNAAKDFGESFKESFGSFAGFVSQFGKAIESALSAMFQEFARFDKISFEGIKSGFQVFAATLESQFPQVSGLKKLVDSIITALQTAIGYVTQTVGPTVGSIVGFIGGVFQTLFSKTGVAIIALGAIVFGLFSLLKAITNMFDGFAKSVAGSIKQVAGSISGYFKTLQKESQAKQMKNLAEAILMMAAALAVLTLVDQSKLLSAALTLGIFSAVLMVLAAAIPLVAGFLTKKFNFDPASSNNFAGAIIQMAFSMLMVVQTVKKIQEAMNEVTPEGGVSFTQALWVLIGAFAGLSVLATLLAVLTSKWNPNATKTTIAYVLQLMGIVTALKILSGISSNLGSAIGALFAVEAAFLILVGVMGALSKYFSGTTGIKWGTMLGAVIGLILVSNHLVKLSSVSWGTIMTGLAKSLAALIAFGIVMKAGSKVASGEAGKTIMGIGAAFFLLVLATKQMAKLNGHEIAHGAAGVFALMIPLKAMMAIGSMAGDQIKSSAQTIVAMAGTIALMALCAALLSLLEPAEMIRGSIAIGALAIVAGGIVALTRFVNKGKQGVKTITALTVMIGLLSGVTIALSFMDTSKSLVALAGMAAVILSLAAVIKSLDDFEAPSIAGIIEVTLMAVVIGGLCTVLSALKVDTALNTTAGIALLLVAMGLCMKIISGTTFDKSTWTGILAMSTMFAAVSAVLTVMSSLNVDASLKVVGSLAGLLVVMTLCMKLLGSSTSQFNGASVLGIVVMSIAIAAIGGVLTLLSMMKVDVALETVLGLSVLLISLSLVMKILGKIDPATMLNACLGLLLVGTTLTLMLLAFSALFGLLGDGSFIINGARILGETIGALIGGIIGGIGTGVTAAMPQMAADLSLFMENLQGFIGYASGGQNGEGINWGGMFAMLGWLTAAAVVAPLAISLPILGNGLISLGQGLNSFFESMKDVDDDRLSIVNGIISSLSTLALGLILFDSGNLQELADGLPNLSESIIGFCNAFTDSNIDSEKAMAAITIFGALAEAASKIPREGGWIGMVFGDIDISGFIAAMGNAGPAIKSFYDNAQGMDSTTVDGALDILKKTIDVASTIPNSGGWLGDVVGNNDLGPFCAMMATAGKDIATFVSDVDGVTYGKAKGALEVLAETVNVASDIPNSGGWLVSGIVGENDLDTFAEMMASAGEDIATFVGDVDGISYSSAAGALEILDATIRCAQGIPNEGLSFASVFVGDNTLDKFAKHMADAAPNLKAFLEAFNGLGRQVRTADGTLVQIDDTTEIFDAATKAVAVLSSSIYAAKNIASTKNWKSTAISDMAKDLAAAGPNLNLFFNSIAGIDIAGEDMQGKVNAMTSFMNNITRITGLGDTTLPDFSKLNGENTIYALADGMIEASESDAVMNKLATVSGNVVGTIDNAMVGQTMVDAANDAITTFKNKLIDYTNLYGYDFVNIGEEIISDIGLGFIGEPMDKTAKQLSEGLISAVKLSLGINSPSTKFQEIGKYIVAGLDLGLQNGTPEVQKTTSRMASALENQFRDDMGIHSPSSLFSKLGGYIVDGLKNGLASGGSMQDIISDVLGGINFDSFGSFGDDIAGIFSGTFDNLDLSSFSMEGLEDGTFVDGLLAKIQDQMDDQGLTAEISAVFNADDLQAQIDAATSGLTGTISTGGTSGIARSTMSSFVNTQFNDGQSQKEGEKNTFSFVQNNYSPTELDRIAIYRQTRNQFAAMKEVINKI